MAEQNSKDGEKKDAKAGAAAAAAKPGAEAPKADAKGEGKGDGKEEAPAGPKLILGLPLVSFLVAVLNLLIVLGGFGFIYFMKMVYKPPVITEKVTKEEIKQTVEKEEKAQLATDGVVRIFTLPEMSINLRSRIGGRNHFATITVAMKCSNDLCMEEMKILRAKVEDTVQSLISARSFAELNMGESSYRLKHEITRNVNSYLKNGTILETFFSDYTVQ